MINNDDHIFADEKIQRYDADTIKHRYGEDWRNYASNVRQITQPDGSIIKEYIIEDPSLLTEIKSSAVDSTSSTTGSDDEQQSSKHKFAQIKAKFEKKIFTNVMASPSSSSVASSHTTTRQNSNRRGSNDSLNRTNMNIPMAPPIPSNGTTSTQSSHRSQSIASEQSKTNSFRRINSVDEADEEVRRIHKQGHHQQHETLTPISSVNGNKQKSNIQYEIVDEDGNPMAIDGVDDLIKMSGVVAREVRQADGSIVKEYVIDDPQLLSKFHSHPSPMVSSYSPQRTSNNTIPPPPPRIPLKQSLLFRQPPSLNDSLPINIQQVQVIEPQRRYEFITTSGKRIEFMIVNSDSERQSINNSDIQELTNAFNTRIIPSSVSNTQQPFTNPKPWHPAVDLTHREKSSSSTRQRTGSDNQPIPHNIAYQQAPSIQTTNLPRSASYGTLNQESYPQQQQQQFAPVFTEPIIDWSALRQQDPHGQIDPALVRQFINQKHQSGSFQTSAQFLPEQPQPTRSMNSPPRNNAPAYYQQQMSYPYQGQPQHGVRILADNNNFNLNQQQKQQQHAAMIANGHARI